MTNFNLWSFPLEPNVMASYTSQSNAISLPKPDVLDWSEVEFDTGSLVTISEVDREDLVPWRPGSLEPFSTLKTADGLYTYAV